MEAKSYYFTPEEIEYLENSWGRVSIDRIASNLNRTANSIMLKSRRLGLGSFLKSGTYITVHQLLIAIGRRGDSDELVKQWVKKGFPLKKRKVRARSFNIVYLDDFWKWAKEYRMHIDFSKFKENALGPEPEWVKEQRKADIAFAKYKTTPWTAEEDNKLKSLLKLYRYTYKQLSAELLRTEGAIKRRLCDLGIKERPLREDPHGVWAEEEVNILVDMYNRGYRSAVIKEYISKSELATNSKIERLIRDGKLTKRK